MVFPVNRLELKRREKFMSQWDLARTSGIVQTRLSLIERGVIRPRRDEVEAISKALNVSTGEVLVLLNHEQAEERPNSKSGSYARAMG